MKGSALLFAVFRNEPLTLVLAEVFLYGLKRFVTYNVLHAAGVFFCGFAVYTYLLQKLGEGFMTVAAFFSTDASQFCETDVRVFFFYFYIAPC